MRSERELLVDCLERLNRLGVPFMLVGSMASHYWGIPRSTHDLDFVLALQLTAVESFTDAFRHGFFVQDEPIRKGFAPVRSKKSNRGWLAGIFGWKSDSSETTGRKNVTRPLTVQTSMVVKSTAIRCQREPDINVGENRLRGREFPLSPRGPDRPRSPRHRFEFVRDLIRS